MLELDHWSLGQRRDFRGNAIRRTPMQLDVVDLRDFYNRPLGGVVRRLLTSRIRSRWRSAQGSQLMGLGFAAPYIGMFRGEAARLGRADARRPRARWCGRRPVPCTA